MKIIVIYEDTRYLKPITYTIGFMLSVLGLEYEILIFSESASKRVRNGDLVISYGRKKLEVNADYQIHFYRSKLFDSGYKTFSSMPQLPLKRWNGLPIIYESQGDIGDFVVRTQNTIETNIDIIASSFFCLSRYEEILVNKRDEHNRFPASASVIYKENFLTRPIVNEYIDLLWEWIDSFDLGYRRRKLWNDKEFVVCLTHDIDSVKKWTLRGIFGELRNCVRIASKQRNPFVAARRTTKLVVSLLSFSDPNWNFRDIMDIEERHGFSSSFYFFGGGKHTLDAKYSLQDPGILYMLKEIKRRGHEIGLHGSFDSYINLEMLQSEKDYMEEAIGAIFSIRQHYLRFDTQRTFAIYEKLGIKCDVTLSFADHEGFRAGFCLPFYPYNIEDDRPFNVLEIPLTVMDTTLINPNYRNMGPEEAWQNIELLLKAVKRHGGCMVLLWHNVQLNEFADYRDVYARVLEWIVNNHGIGTSAKSVLSMNGSLFSNVDWLVPQGLISKRK